MRHRRYLGAILMAGLILLAATAGAGAGGERARPTAELVRAAQQLLHGQLSRKDVAADAKGRIWTTYTLVVRETLKGAATTGAGAAPAGSTRTFRQLGGTLGQITCRAGFGRCQLLLHPHPQTARTGRAQRDRALL